MAEITSAEPRRAAQGRALTAVVAAIAINSGGAVIGGLFGPEPGGWYFQLAKPEATPAPWVFPAAWTTLYTLMAIAFARLWHAPESPGRSAALAAFAVQLTLNYAWSAVFFGLQDLTLATLAAAVLFAAVVAAATAAAWVDRTAGWLMAPYVAWTGFALWLTWTIWSLNPAG